MSKGGGLLRKGREWGEGVWLTNEREWGEGVRLSCVEEGERGAGKIESRAGPQHVRAARGRHEPRLTATVLHCCLS